MAGPVNQRSLEADVATGLLGFDPLVAEDLFAFSQELGV